MQIQEEGKKDLRQSLVSNNLNAEDVEEEVTEVQSCPIPEHLSNWKNIDKICKISLNNLSKRFKWNESFMSKINIQVLETNFESMKVKLHYGNFELQVSVIYTQVDEKIIEQGNSQSGAFGIVRFIKYEGIKHAVKGVKILYQENDLNFDDAYKEYFLYVMAELMEIGPKMTNLFGYDILLTKNMVFFAMEGCQPNQLQSIQAIYADLLQNLKVMHSVGFIHIDIKPANIAYSPSLQKTIFLDFGLSKLINQKPGKKSRTKFTGTVSFCSDEMKKYYILSTMGFVDLYENDLCCLKNTKKVLEKAFNYSLKIKKFMKNGSFFPKQQINELQNFKKIVSILRLKYFIQTENKKEVLKHIKNTNENKRVVYEILNSSKIPKSLAEDSAILQEKNLIKTQINAPDYKVDKVDILLCQFFSEVHNSILAEKIIPISHILQLQRAYFDRYLTSPELLLKLFHFIQPFSQSCLENRWQLRKKLVNKIYEMKWTDTKSILMFDRARFVTIYFCEKLKGLKNARILMQLRLLCISVQRWDYILELQDTIMTAITDPFLKVLKLTEFTLFQCVISQDFRQLNIKKLQKCMILAQLNLCDTKKSKAKTFLSLIIENTDFENYTEQFRLELFNLVKQISQICSCQQQKQAIYLIKHLLAELCKLHYTAVLQDPPQGLVLQIYSSPCMTLKAQLSKIEQKQYELFWPVYRQIENLGYSKETFKEIMENSIKAMDSQKVPIRIVMTQVLQLIFADKKFFPYFLDKIQEAFSNPMVSNISSLFWCINFFLNIIILNKHEVESQRINIQEKIQLIEKLQKILKNWTLNQAIKSKITQYKPLKLHLSIIKAKMRLEKGESPDHLEEALRQIVALMQPLPYKFYSMAVEFIQLFHYFSDHLYLAPDHFSKKILINFVQQYIAKKHFFIISRFRHVLNNFMRIKNEQGKEKENLSMILSLLDKSELFTNKVQQHYIHLSVRGFCDTLPINRLLNIYSSLKINKRQFLCGRYAYLVAYIFIQVQHKMPECQQLKQLIQSTLCLKNIHTFFLCELRPGLFRLYKYLINFKTKRKSFICSKFELKYTNDDIKINSIINNFQNKTQKFTKKNIEKVSDKLIKKWENMRKLQLSK